MSFKVVGCAAFLALLTACGGGGGSTATPQAHTFNMNLTATGTTQTKGAALFNPLDKAAPMDSVDPTQVQLLMGIAAGQYNPVVTGYSAKANVSDIYAVSTVCNDSLNNGITLGHTGTSQTFSSTDPSMLPGFTGSGSGTATGGVGLFMANFSSTSLTTINMVTLSSNLSQVDEVVLQCAPFSIQPLTNGGSLVVCPHVINGGQMYTDENQTLTANGQNWVFGSTQYFFFAPASKIGTQSYTVVPTGVVVDNLTQSATWTTGTLIDPSSSLDPETWINMSGNEGLKSAIDAMVAAQNSISVTELSLATNFQAYFSKFTAANCCVFSSGYLGNGWFPASFEIIPLDDSKGALQVNGTGTLNVVWDAGNTNYTLNSGVMDMAGQPRSCSPPTLPARLRPVDCM